MTRKHKTESEPIVSPSSASPVRARRTPSTARRSTPAKAEPSATQFVLPTAAAVPPAATQAAASRKLVKPTATRPTPSREEIAIQAYLYAEARGFQGGSEEEDWLRAERELLSRV